MLSLTSSTHTEFSLQHQTLQLPRGQPWMYVQLDQPVNMHVSFYMANFYGYPSIVATHVSKEGYSQLATLAFQNGLKLFRLRPKVHMLFEIALLIDKPSPTLNPQAVACWSDEDYIGRISRIARGCHGLTCSISTMRKALGNYQVQMKRFAAKKQFKWLSKPHRCQKVWVCECVTERADWSLRNWCKLLTRWTLLESENY